MKYDDLLNVPFKWGGRSMDGMDCYGIVAECCRRAGTPLADPFRELGSSIPYDEAERIRRQAINMEEVATPAVGRIVYAELGGRSHVGYIVERGKAINASQGRLPKVLPLSVFKNPRYFEVLPLEGE